MKNIKNSTLNFGKINTFVLLGGGVLLSRFALYLKEQGRDFCVVTSPRHALKELDIDEPVPFQEFITKNKIAFHVSEDINTDKKVDSLISDDTLGISFGAAWIFKKAIIEKFKGRLVNVHGTNLPRNRGGGGFSWTILQNDYNGYNTIHAIDEGVDTGFIVKRRSFIYPPTCLTPQDFHRTYVQETLVFLQEFTQEINEGKDFYLITQEEKDSTYWPRLCTDIHGFINWSWTLDEIVRFICAFGAPYAGASTFLGQKRIYILKAFKRDDPERFHPFQDGLVFRKDKESLFIAKKEGTLVVTEVLDEQRADCFSAVKVGDRLYTPQSYIEKAFMFRAQYNAKGLV